METLFLKEKTEKWIAVYDKIIQKEGKTFKAYQEISKFIGAHPDEKDVIFIYWLPEIQENKIKDQKAFIEIFKPEDKINFRKNTQTMEFSKTRIPVLFKDDFAFCAVSGLNIGLHEKTGDFYWLVYEDTEGKEQTVRDPLSYSVPFGSYSPAEIYDFKTMVSERKDQSYYERLNHEKEGDHIKISTPVNLLQVHPLTSSDSKSIKGLTDIYKDIADKISQNKELCAAEKHFISYEGIQLMPIEPVIEYEENPGSFFKASQPSAESKVKVELKKPDVSSWGYDVSIIGTPAVNPVILETGRPDELLEFIETLHEFPENPVKVVIDVVFGHSDNQGLNFMNPHFFAGPNMYGQNMNYQNPVVRAVLLEMQRRKVNYGIDGIRIDGAQDFKYWHHEEQRAYHDDEYLQSMSDVIQEACGYTYYPWMIFEDGRPWPQEDWEISSTYHCVIDQQPDTFQWGPLTFAHNTPFLYTFWMVKWWRIKEIFEFGSHWITGCTNHDTVRRGTQIDPESRINRNLGDTLPEIIRNAYDNPADKLLTYCAFPGVPMDFLNASFHSAWSYIRNTDYRYGVKILAEERGFLDWQITVEEFNHPEVFSRIKKHGFKTLEGFKKFLKVLSDSVDITDYDLDKIPPIINSVIPALEATPVNVKELRQMARDFMDDIRDFCNLSGRWEIQDNIRSSFNQKVRDFRISHPWLVNDLKEEESYRYLHPTTGAAVFAVERVSPDKKTRILFVGNMEGQLKKIIPAELVKEEYKNADWKLELTSPGLKTEAFNKEIAIKNGEGFVFVLENS